jgi:peptide/nickel transport system permease protein
VVIFGATELLPGDLATRASGQSATPETLAALREQLGLNDPAPLRYWNWLTGVGEGDFGVSMANNRPISETDRRAAGQHGVPGACMPRPWRCRSR